MQKKVVVYKNSFECGKDIFKTEGTKGIFQGFFATIAREIPAYVGQFVVYEFLKRNVFAPGKFLGPVATKKNHVEEGQSPRISGWRAMISGGVAGLICWLISFPPDVVKTQIQCMPRNHFKAILYDGGFLFVSKKVYKEQVIFI